MVQIVITSKKIIKAIKSWWRRRRRVHYFNSVVICDPVSDPTSALQGHNLVLIGTVEKVKWLQFKCPCRCGEIISLNLMGSYHPQWMVETHKDGSITVSPSVDSTV